MALSIIFTQCGQQETIQTTNSDITGDIVGPHSGNYNLIFAVSLKKNYSNQISLLVSRINSKTIEINTQGGDSFECVITGSSTSNVFSDLQNPLGIYSFATDIEGYFVNGALYFKVSGIQNGEFIYAEFTVI